MKYIHLSHTSWTNSIKWCCIYCILLVCGLEVVPSYEVQRLMLGRWCWWRDELLLRLLLKWAAVSESVWQLKWVMAICKLSWHVCWSKTALSLTMTAIISFNTVNTFNLVWSIVKNKFVMVGETRWCCIEQGISVVAQDSLHHLFSQEDKKTRGVKCWKGFNSKAWGKKSSGRRDSRANVKV